MKKLTILLVLIFSFLFSTTSWGDWKFIVKGVRGDKFYYEKDRVRKGGKFIYFWELVDYIKPFKGELSSTKYVELDCSISRFKWLKLQLYNKSMGEGNISRDVTPLDKWMYPKPDSIGEIMYKKICEEHQ